MNHRGVQNGTPVGDESLCNTCTNARVIKGYSDTERITVCDWGSETMKVPFRVRECSGYSDRRIPPLYEMKQIAWMLVSKGAGRNIGFVSAAEFQKLQNEDENEDSS